MQPELTLNTKCPACGALTPKTLDCIKALKAFDCECGFHASILQPAMSQARRTGRKGKVPSTV